MLSSAAPRRPSHKLSLQTAPPAMPANKRTTIRDSEPRRGCGRTRTVERLFYVHIVLLVVITACSVTVWVFIRRYHVENLYTAHRWANSYRQIMIFSKIDGQLRNGDKDTFYNVQTHFNLFRDYHNANHAADRSRLPVLTEEHTTAIETWVNIIAAVLQKAVAKSHSNLLPDTYGDSADAADRSLMAIVDGYTTLMGQIDNNHFDVIGMCFLGLTTVVVVLLMFLVRSEYLQHQQTTQLAEELASVIHDVRTPQQVIVSAIALLSQPGAPPVADCAELVQVLHSNFTF